ncbi:MAG: hypothetical protein C0402_11595 [Thermodesulfovibrio sp.]|nr:hypothetical protein [Thermodesulfovibrio sp.]
MYYCCFHLQNLASYYCMYFLAGPGNSAIHCCCRISSLLVRHGTSCSIPRIAVRLFSEQRNREEMMKYLMKHYWFLALCLVAVFSVAFDADAALITVNSTEDSLAVDGNCTLREAVIAANTNTAVDGCTAGDSEPTFDGIIVPAGTFILTLVGRNEQFAQAGDLDVRENTNISGAGPGLTMIVGLPGDRVFHTQGTVVIQNMTIQGGDVSDYDNNTETTTEQFGGVISAGAQLELQDVIVTGGTANRGGGVYAHAALSFTRVTITENAARSTVWPAFGGGLYIVNDAIGGGYVAKSLIANNTASWHGGGIYIQNSEGTTTLHNSTLSGNSAEGHGGGLRVTYAYGAGTIALVNMTITNNTADSNGDGFGDGGGIHVDADEFDVTLDHVLLAGNTDGSVGDALADRSPDCSGRLLSNSYNLIGDGTNCTIVGDQIGNQIGDWTAPRDPRIGPLADNGGPTLTHALLSDSPAIDASPLQCSFSDDQRGVVRPRDGNMDHVLKCDIGAFEREGAPWTAVITVNNNLDDGSGCTLRYAIESAKSNSVWGACTPSGNWGHELIVFDQGVVGTIAITPGNYLPTITESFTLVGPGSGILAVDFQDDGLVNVDSPGDNQTLSVFGLTFTRGGGGNGGCFQMHSGDSLSLNDVVLDACNGNFGGGIYAVSGAVSLTDSIIRNCHSIYDGGGIYHSGSLGSGSLFLSGTTISGNTISVGGAGGGIYSRAPSLAIDKSTIAGNTAKSGEGGGIYASGVTGGTITGSTVSTNHADTLGFGAGGLFVDGSMTVTDSTVSSNTTAGSGGGIFLNTAGSLTMKNSTVSENSSQHGAGIASAGLLNVVNSTVSGNTAKCFGGGLNSLTAGDLFLANATVTANVAGTDCVIAGEGGGVYIAWNAGELNLRNSIIAGNSGGTSPDCYTDWRNDLTSEGYNLIGDNRGCTVVFASGDLWGNVSGGGSAINPQLGPLSDNGGPTFTHKLLAGSPALDLGNPGGCEWDNDVNPVTPAVSLTTDQRGANRYADGNGDTFNVCDIGAYEYTGDTDEDGIPDNSDRCIQNKPAMSGVTEYSTVQAAMNAAAVGDGVVKVQAGTFSQSVTVSQAGAVTVRGHYTCDFTGLELADKTILGGPFTIGTGGPVTFDGFGL